MSDRAGRPWAIARRLRRWPPVYRVARRAWTAVGSVLPPTTVEGVPGPVHRNDLMVDRADPYSRSTYATTGRRVVDLLEEALVAAGGRLADADVLDFGCGHGRVVRHLTPLARSVAACDLDHEGVRFCAKAFGATPVPGHADLSRVALGTYDAIWLGSVITHHPPAVVAELLQALAGHLRPGGVLVLSSADGTTLAANLAADGMWWMASHADRLRRELDDPGATYVAYPQSADGSYGLGYQSVGWLDAAVAPSGLVPLWHRPVDFDAQRTDAWRLPG